MTASATMRAALWIGLVVLALFQLRTAVISQSTYSGLSPNKAIRKYQQDPQFLVAYGRQAIVSEGNLQAAEHFYQRALIANPLYIPAWLALSELRNDEKQPEQASKILDYTDTLTRDVARWRWNKAMLAYQLDRSDILASDLSWLLREEKVTRQTRRKAAKLACALWPEPAQLIEKMGSGSVVPLFRFGVSSKNLDLTRSLWPLYNQTKPAAKQVLPYINLLINSKDISAAAEIWHAYYPADTLFYNGNFSSPPIRGGFGWRIWKKEGVIADIENRVKKNAALHLRFTGKRNIAYSHTRQYVPLEPGQKYRLSGIIRSQGLSTDQRPFIEVVGLHCTMPPADTVSIAKSQDWTPFSLLFTVPQECKAVQVQVRRKTSKKIDNLISGDLWLTDFSLQPAEQHADTTQLDPHT